MLSVRQQRLSAVIHLKDGGGPAILLSYFISCIGEIEIIGISSNSYHNQLLFNEFPAKGSSFLNIIYRGHTKDLVIVPGMHSVSRSDGSDILRSELLSRLYIFYHKQRPAKSPLRGLLVTDPVIIRA